MINCRKTAIYDAKCARSFHFRDRAKIAELYLLSLFIRLIEYRSRGNVWKPNSVPNQVFAPVFC